MNKITIRFMNKDGKYNIYHDIDYKYQLTIYASSCEKFINLISDKEQMKRDFIDEIDFLETIDSDVYLVQDFIDGKKDFFEDDYDIYIEGTIEEIKQFLENNDELQNKKVIVSPLNFDSGVNIEDEDFVLEACNKLDMYNNVYVKGEGNREFTNLNDYKKTIDFINDIVDRVNQYDFSPIEQIMYVYDIVRDRVYVEENEEESYSLSRDLTSVILGDKIVCVGFSNMFVTILRRLGFFPEKDVIGKKDDPTIGHERVFLHVTDKKYGINGLYFFDPTWDSKKDDNNSYLSSYRYFAKSLSDITMLQSKYEKTFICKFNAEFIDNYLKEYKLRKLDRHQVSFVNMVFSMVTNKELYNGFEMVSNDYYKYSYEEMEQILYKTIYVLNTKLDPRILFTALYNVRKIEYYENPQKYQFDVENMLEISKKSLWLDSESPQSLLLHSIFGDEVVGETKIRKYVDEQEYEKEISRIKLTKTLQLGVNNKKTNIKLDNHKNG